LAESNLIELFYRGGHAEQFHTADEGEEDRKENRENPANDIFHRDQLTPYPM